MRNEKQQSRRVVSTREYLSFLGKKAALSTSSLLLLIAFILLFAAAAACVLTATVQVIARLAGMKLKTDIRYLLLGAAVAGSLCYALARVADRAFQSLIKIEPVAPPTRHNIGDLPENETLVRASEEPPTHQSDVLLRAAQGSKETPEEQLLRSVEE